MNVNEQQTAPAPDMSGAVPDAANAASPDATAANPAVTATANAVTPDAFPAVETEPDYRAMYESLKRENEILRHNAEIAQSAPVQGVTGGGVSNVPVDDFIRGFDSDTW